MPIAVGAEPGQQGGGIGHQRFQADGRADGVLPMGQVIGTRHDPSPRIDRHRLVRQFIGIDCGERLPFGQRHSGFPRPPNRDGSAALSGDAGSQPLPLCAGAPSACGSRSQQGGAGSRAVGADFPLRDAARARRVPIRVRRGVRAKLADLVTAIARIGLRQLEGKRRMLDAVSKQLERARWDYAFVYARNMVRKSRVALAREVRIRRAAASVGAGTLTQTCLRGFQEALFYLKESGVADDVTLVRRCDGDPWKGCYDDVDLLRSRLIERFADPVFRIPLDLRR